MDSKLALVDSIEKIKEKLTSQEYKEILENLAKVIVSTNEYKTSSGSDSDLDSEETRRQAERWAEIPNIEINMWDGIAVVKNNLRNFESIFSRPVRISIELATFLGIHEIHRENIFVSRRIVTRFINLYIREHNLQKVENKFIIDFNKPGGQLLWTLLRVPENTELTIFGVQRYLKVHYIRPIPTE